jgi:hypothetical protein
MEKVTVEIEQELRDRLIPKLSQMQDELYEEQVLETDPNVKDNIMKQFMNVTNIIQTLEEWKLKEGK